MEHDQPITPTKAAVDLFHAIKAAIVARCEVQR